MSEIPQDRPFENLGTGTYSRKKHVAEDLVDSGQCHDYEEAYKLLEGMRSGDVLRTFRGYVRKQ